jgi:hypothetical protein
MSEYHSSAEIRAEFESRLGRHVDDAVWQKLLATEYGDLDEPLVLEWDLERVIKGMLEFVATLTTNTSATVDLAPPASWTNFWRTSVLPTFRDDQLRCLGAFGLRDPVASADLTAFIDETARSRWEQSGLSSGANSDFALSLKVRSIDAGRASSKTVSFPYEPNSPLLFLKETAGALMRQNPEISEEDAIGYLLADVAFSPTWLKAKWDFWGHVQLTVGSLEVRPEEVAAAYASARRDYLSRVKKEAETFDEIWALMGARGWLTRDYRRSADDHTDLVQFMNGRMENGVTRRAAAQAWKQEHPEDERKVDSLTRTYLRYATKGVL